jgi:2-phosphoglycerate kinase
VVLIGGTSGAGKSRLAAGLARCYDADHLQLDDISAALAAMTTPEMFPALHLWRTDWPAFAALSDEQRLEHYREVAGIYLPGILAIIENCLESGRRVVVDGDFILPDMIASEAAAGDSDQAIRGLILAEESRDQLAQNLDAREGSQHELRARAAHLVNGWLEGQARRWGVPMLRARPWDTVMERAVGLLQGSSPSPVASLHERIY